MIYLYSGTPGSGKSCHQAEDIIEYMQHKEAVVMANYEVNQDLLKKYAHKTAEFVTCCNDEITPANLIKFSRYVFKTRKFKEGKIKLYIDEAQLIFNCRDWNARDRNAWVKFFTQHRKYGYDVYLIAQWDRMLDRQIRALIEYEYKHRKMANAGTTGKIINIGLGGGVYVCAKYWYPMQQRIGQEVHHIRRKYYSFYDSYMDFETGETSKDMSVSSSRNAEAVPG